MLAYSTNPNVTTAYSIKADRIAKHESYLEYLNSLPQIERYRIELQNEVRKGIKIARKCNPLHVDVIQDTYEISAHDAYLMEAEERAQDAMIEMHFDYVDPEEWNIIRKDIAASLVKGKPVFDSIHAYIRRLRKANK